jgi:hypothetical protein
MGADSPLWDREIPSRESGEAERPPARKEK